MSRFRIRTPVFFTGLSLLWHKNNWQIYTIDFILTFKDRILTLAGKSLETFQAYGIISIHIVSQEVTV